MVGKEKRGIQMSCIVKEGPLAFYTGGDYLRFNDSGANQSQLKCSKSRVTLISVSDKL